MNDLPTSVLLAPDENGRQINVFHAEHVQPISRYYPNVLLFAHERKQAFCPVREKIMSIPDAVFNKHDAKLEPILGVEFNPVFFFVYNLDNYYHFVYDTLPYLLTYQHLKKQIPGLRLLTDFGFQKTTFCPFVLEFLRLFDIEESDLLFIDTQVLYRNMYISSSYTHDYKSNLPPRKEVYELYERLASMVPSNNSFPNKIYVSRRSHAHGQYDNMGTDYTARRRLINEDDLVDYLKTRGYEEVFTELLSTEDKIAMFKNCTHVVGPIGGGLCNVLFSRPSLQLTAIVSPLFLDINGRFVHSFANVNTTYFQHTQHVETSRIKKHMRVRVKSLGVTGEIDEIDGSRFSVLYSHEHLAGWNAKVHFNRIWVTEDSIEPIDSGLNSAWSMDLNKFRELNNV
jgi:hypothetical protein